MKIVSHTKTFLHTKVCWCPKVDTTLRSKLNFSIPHFAFANCFHFKFNFSLFPKNFLNFREPFLVKIPVSASFHTKTFLHI